MDKKKLTKYPAYTYQTGTVLIVTAGLACNSKSFPLTTPLLLLSLSLFHCASLTAHWHSCGSGSDTRAVSCYIPFSAGLVYSYDLWPIGLELHCRPSTSKFVSSTDPVVTNMTCPSICNTYIMFRTLYSTDLTVTWAERVSFHSFSVTVRSLAVARSWSRPRHVLQVASLEIPCLQPTPGRKIIVRAGSWAITFAM